MSEAAATSGAFRGGEDIGHYRVLSMLGAGGMGVVYKALDLQLERTVALKFLLPQAAFSKDERQQLLREAKSASQLDHANIGVVHGLEQTPDGEWFIVMAYYEGGTLERKIGSLLTVQALDIAAQVARGLAEAHAHNIIHRDIKPSNVMFGAGGVVKIVDFGIARLMPTASATLSTDAKGTAAYMAPEQIVGRGADHRSDIWSLGVVLAQMLTGKYPFAGDNLGAKLYAIVNSAPLSLQGVPASVQAIVYRALAKDPAHRYQSCQEMLADIEEAKAQSSQPTQPLARADRMPKAYDTPAFVRELKQRASTPAGIKPSRKRNAVIVVIVLVLGLITGVLFGPSAVEQFRNSWFQQREKHIAVLPFDVIGNDPAVTPLADGLMDTLTSRLSNLDTGQHPLWVVPASVVRRQKVDDPRSALRELGATLVVKGSIQRAGPHVRLIVNLISTRPVRQLASEDVEDESGDFAMLQDRAVERLAHVMDVATGKHTEPGDTRVTTAYEDYLKALGYMQRYDKPGNLDLAVSELMSATQRDPHFALGFAQLGEAYRLEYAVDKNLEWTDKALAACDQALSINDQIARAWVTSGRIHTDRGQHEIALKEYERALQLAPRDQDVLAGLARGYESAGKLARAEETYKNAVAMRPDYWNGYNTLALFYYRQKRYAEGIAPLEQALKLTPDNSALYANLAAMYLGTNDPKDFPQAERVLKRSIEIAPTYAAYTNLGFLYMQQKRWAEAAAISEKAAELNGSDSEVWQNIALANDWIGNAAKAATAREKQFALVSQAATKNPRDAEVQAELAALFAHKHDPINAREHIRGALALGAQDGETFLDIAVAYELLGDRTQAILYSRKALTKGSTMADIQRTASLQGVVADPRFKR
jgi:serine/threonine-protein kinase